MIKDARLFIVDVVAVCRTPLQCLTDVFPTLCGHSRKLSA